MAKKSTLAEIEISKTEARRFMARHHFLWPPRQLKGREGVLEYLRRVGCIQFDPINMVGRNPDLVLQARIANYRPQLLQNMLYSERSLIDGWDKLASIYPVEDWRFFNHHRTRMINQWGKYIRPKGRLKVASKVLEAIGSRGPLSSIDIEHDERLHWDWGFSASAVRAAMEVLYAMGELGIHHRVNTRRVFDLTKNLIPGNIRTAADPNTNPETYEEWHVLRRIGGLGLAHAGAGERWLGISDVKASRGHAKAPQRNAALRRLHEKEKIIRVRVEGWPKEPFYIRKQDLATLEATNKDTQPRRGAAILAPLDNFMWDRSLLRRIFDFDYVWEVYVPQSKRKYGYYVLPVFYGDRFVARFDPSFDKTRRVLTIQNWWWEEGVTRKDEALLAALGRCMAAFTKYLGAEQVFLGERPKKDGALRTAVRDAIR